MKLYKKILIPLLVVAVTLGLFRSVFFIGYVPSESMEPTLKQGSVILGWRLYKEISAGDIIVFNHEGRLLVKRVAAVGGDTVRINETDQTVPEDCFYVLGDNTENSYDSRYWSDPFVQETDILAKVICRNILPAGVLFLFKYAGGLFAFLRDNML